MRGTDTEDEAHCPPSRQGVLADGRERLRQAIQDRVASSFNTFLGIERQNKDIPKVIKN
jgi:hypothetical protein